MKGVYAGAGPGEGGSRRGWSPRRVGMLLIVVTAIAMVFDTPPQQWLRLQLFDIYQQWQPRERSSAPAVVVEIDEASLTAYGQWPWPRTQLAALIERIGSHAPAAIGVDIILPEPDRLSPARVLKALPDLDPLLAARIAALPDNDAVLAVSLKANPTVLGMAGENGAGPVAPSGRGLYVAPIRWRSVRGEVKAEVAAPGLEHFDRAVRSLPELEAAAAGTGLLNNPEPSSPVVRRPLLLGRVGDTVVPALAVELLRVATGTRWIDAQLEGDALRGIGLGDVQVPADADGRLWMRYGQSDSSRYVSAKDVMDGQVPDEVLANKMVLLAVTGLGLLDLRATPLREQVFGIEIHLQLIENIFDRSWLTRPDSAVLAEALGFLLLALLLVVLATSVAHAWALSAGLAELVVLAVIGLASFSSGYLYDVATPAIGLALIYGSLLVTSLSESRRHRTELALQLREQSEQAARLTGELDAARRVQLGMLPESPDVRAGEMRMEIKAYMEPAKTVGGDLYDFFMLDDETLFVLIGDVSGKGLPAAIFMALVKSLCKSVALRRTRSLAESIADAEAEIIRENPEMMFVTLTVLTLNLANGEVEYCNAGHDPAFSILDRRPGHLRLADGGGPPLCVMPGFAYQSGRHRMAPGEMLCLITDGVTDATNARGEMYGRQRLESALEGIASEDPATVVGTLRQLLQMYSAGSEPADDQTVVVMRWNGPGTRGLLGV